MSDSKPPVIESVDASVLLPEHAHSCIANHISLKSGERMRLAYVGGPADVVGTYEHWIEGKHDPRVPVFTHSAQFYSLAKKLDAQGLVLTEPASSPKSSTSSIAFVRVERNRQGKGIRWHLDQSAYARRLLIVLKEFMPHALIIGSDLPPWFYLLLPKKIKVIVTLHNTFWPMGCPPTSFIQRGRISLLGLSLRRSIGAVCTSGESANQLKSLIGAKAPVLVEIPQITFDQTGPPKQRQKIQRLIFLGRIEISKGVIDLINVFNSVAPRFPDISLCVAGSGTAEDELRSAIKMSPHRDRISFPGRLTADQARAVLRESDLLICPTRSSYAGGRALVVAEAAVQGLPSLTSSVVPASLLVPKACVTFPADDLSAFEIALVRLLEDNPLYGRMVTAASDYRPEFFNRSKSWGSRLGLALMGQKEA